MPRPRYLGIVPLAAALAALGFAAPMPAKAQGVAVDGSNRTELLDCNGGDAVVNGSGNKLVLHGPCRTLRVNGSDNAVEVDLIPGGGLAVMGTDNRITYTPIVPGPALTAQGANNLVGPGNGGEASAALAPAIPAAPPPPVVLAPAAPDAGTLVLVGDGQDRTLSCADRNVLIEGSHGSFTLSGGCRGLTVQGHDDTVTAVLIPGAHVAIGGDGVTLHYMLTSAGPPPVVTVNGAGSQAVVGAAQ